ncbi:zinc finger CCHC-type and RNA-binding motif-containing protein 1-like [Arachis ipaensis]|uniref:zinc finger CCHC-type and RNA-binding motif-containing protein 1-like n=1 Tax=Arachis ipaensis TaxID=130454 RepID=UPI0007AFE1C6|nr:zinc finger CCHC-type and RNA-binding motif-containing protein 1-like [Arachis ipaensis]XP_025670006.1 zinc finger CCHC-type and RNA-binding motif-containing protein 1-like [Arachis hypogaea]
MTYDDLRGSLLVFENTYLKKDTKKKGVALKSVTESLDEESSDDLSNDDFVLFGKKIRRMMKQKERNKGGSSRKPKRDLSKVICHNCREVGHYKFDCPKLKKEDKPKSEKKKGLMASWEDLENDSEEEEESDRKSQTCLMAD